MSLKRDAVVFETTPEALIDAVRRVATKGELTDDETYILERTTLAKNGKLTKDGQTLFRQAWVLKKSDDAYQAMVERLRSLVPIQVVEQELRGYGAVPDDGVLELLRLHRVAPADDSVAAVRVMLKWLSKAGIAIYSNKFKTVRVLPLDAESAAAGETRALPALISPRTPFSNLVRLRNILRLQKGVVWWADPHFNARALEELVDAIDQGSVSELRIISGTQAVNDKGKKDFAKFQVEMDAKGVATEWRVDDQRDWHDRWLVDDDGAYNMPPVNTLFKGDYSEMLPTDARPPLDEWWSRSAPL